MMLSVDLAGFVGYMWLFAALFLLMCEVLTPGLFFFVAFAVGATVGGVVAFLGYTLSIQYTAAFVATVMALVVIRRSVAEYGGSDGHVKTNYEALVGKQAFVVEPCGGDAPGRVKVRGEVWPAKALSKTKLAVGTHVRIVRIEGNHLIIQA